ncbi:MAG: DUF58 domain-containing protein [Anaerolineae bacterium]|jgi:uncharacterized protein (DUF58 family)|nr:DUF58 domain-containing protein [Anaerolineae bacterium]MDH7473901.1 DUF58 domain-containing protein [Anaerolineae bacterium]
MKSEPSTLPSYQPSTLPSPHLFDETFLHKLERLSILSRRAMAGQLQGERRSPKRGQSVEFADFRPYSPGDDFRRIDWNAYARLERFFLKLFVEEEDLTVHLLVDTSRSMDWGQPNKLWYAVRAAGALGYIALASLDRVTVSAFSQQIGETFPPHRGKQQAMALFAFLQELAPQADTDLKAALRNYANTATNPGPLLLVSDLLDDGWREGLTALAARGFEATVLHLLSPDEVNPPLTGDLKLLDVETNRPVEITADYDLLARYRQELTNWQDELRAFCGGRGMNYVAVTTDVPFEELIFSFLRRRGVLR